MSFLYRVKITVIKIVLEVPDQDVARVLELVKGIKRVKIKSPKPGRTAATTQFMSKLSEAIQQVSAIAQGKAKGRPWKELYDEVKAENAEAG